MTPYNEVLVERRQSSAKNSSFLIKTIVRNTPTPPVAIPPIVVPSSYRQWKKKLVTIP